MFCFLVECDIKCELFNAKDILVEEQLWYYLTHSGGKKWAHNFLGVLVRKWT